MSELYTKKEKKTRRGEIRICPRLWTISQNYIAVQTNIHKTNVAIIQAEKHIVKDGIYPKQRFKSHYQKCFMQPSNTEEEMPRKRAVMPWAKRRTQSMSLLKSLGG
jgi:hypothetical protein